ncbi:MAG: T9SS type A sorting domain-containing protein [Chitinophagaceae bacterium]|nr:T9SS type A sorting domain-containing protein [Chitinophagaceae bacterium]
MKTKILLALLTCFFLLFVSRVNAQGGILPLNSSVNGNLTSATPDVYTITTTSDGLLRLRFTTVSPADLYVTLYDNDGTTAISAQAESYNNSTVTVIVDGLAPGTYKAKIIPYGSSFGAYTLADSLFTAPLANDAEPNGTAATAVTLPQNSGMTGHVGYYYNHLRDTADWYRVTTTADGLLRVYLKTDSGSIYSTTTTNPLDVNLDLYDNDGITLLGHVEVFNGYGKATNLITADGLAPGTYYIKVQNYSASEFANYTISDSLFLTPVISDAEPNGTVATALNLPINSNVTGHTGYYYNKQRDTADWYKVTTTSTGPLRIILKTLKASIYSTNVTNPLDFNIFLYSSDGTTQLGSREVFNGYNPTTDSLVINGLAAGTYYIRIQPFSTGEFGDYKLAVLNASGVLPVTFINFDGVLRNNQALLSWSTATEINNKGFEIEKSMDGRSFTGIGFVQGNGTSSRVNKYGYVDNKVLSGFNYYRLKQVDIDGKFNYSSTIRLDFKNFGWTIFGNPVLSNSWIQLQLAKTSNVVIQVLSVDGKVIKSIDKGTIPEGTYSIPLNLNNISSGIYIVKLVADNQIYSKEIIK